MEVEGSNLMEALQLKLKEEGDVHKKKRKHKKDTD